MTVGWIKYVQSVNRLKRKNPLNYKKLLIGFASPQHHESVIKIRNAP